MPANVGAPADVPPTAEKLESLARKPVLQLVALTLWLVKKSCEQIRYGSCPFDPFNATSGTSRWPSAGTPVPVCHEGFPKIVLAPPPVAARPPPPARED